MYQVFHTFITKLILTEVFFFFELMVLRMITFYRLQVAKMNEEPP
jgi:hypothetical protein